MQNIIIIDGINVVIDSNNEHIVIQQYWLFQYVFDNIYDDICIQLLPKLLLIINKILTIGKSFIYSKCFQ